MGPLMDRVMMRADGGLKDSPIAVRYGYWVGEGGIGKSGISIWFGTDFQISHLERGMEHSFKDVLAQCKGCERSANEAMAGLAILSISR